MSTIEAKEVDFQVLSEDFSRYTLNDRTLLKAKVVVKKILAHPEKTPEGYPIQIALDTINVVSAIVDQSEKRDPSKDPINLQTDKGEEIEFKEFGEPKLQRYMTVDGYSVTVKPIVTKVLKYKKYNNYGEPVYQAIIQAITNVEKSDLKQ